MAKSVINAGKEPGIVFSDADGDGKPGRGELYVVKLLTIGVVERNRCVHHNGVKATKDKINVGMGLVVIRLDLGDAKLLQIALCKGGLQRSHRVRRQILRRADSCLVKPDGHA